MAVDKLQYSIGNAASTTLSTSITNTDTSAALTSDTNFAAKSGEGMVLLDEGLAAEELAYSTGKTGATLAIPLANRGLEGGSAQPHSGQATVKGVLTAGMWNNLIDSVCNALVKATGALDTTKVVDLTTAQTLTTKTLTTPVIASIYQDAGKTKLMTVPDTASDTLAAIAATQTLTNKRNNPRVVTAASYTTDTGTSLSVATCDEFVITAQAGALKFNNPGGTPVEGQKLLVRIKDDGTARALTYDTQFRALGTALPSTTVLGKTLYLGFIFNSTDTKWDLVAAAQEA